MQKNRVTLGLTALVGVASLFLVRCSSDAVDCAEAKTCTSPDDGGGAHEAGEIDAGSDSGDVLTPPGCDPLADAKDAPSCVVNAFGVFVDATGGDDANDGSKDAPVKSIGVALTKLAGKPRLYLCGEGPFKETVELTSSVSLYGGFTCGTWAHDGSKAKIAPEQSGYALSITGANDPVVVADLDLTSLDATEPSASSIAAFVSRSSSVTFRRTRIAAGKGASGTDGALLTDFMPRNAPNGTSGSTGGAATPNNKCPTSIGGAGGKDGAVAGKDGQVAITPAFPAGYSGKGGGGGKLCNDSGGGSSGSYGIAGLGGAGATKPGELTAEGWKSADGIPGGSGGNGQGGGGGGQINPGGIGGAGGPGGCGGAGGAKGTAGGSSIALLVFESTVALHQSVLLAHDAGRGGNGGKGQMGQLGNLLAAQSNGADACSGGFGGIGGSGGGGGGGAGGLSVGILYKGNPPTIEGTATPAADTLASITVGNKGVAGNKGDGGDPARTNAPASRGGESGAPGVDGAAKAVMSAP